MQENFALASSVFYWICAKHFKIANSKVDSFMQRSFSLFNRNKIKKTYSQIGRFQFIEVKNQKNAKQEIIIDTCHNVAAVKNFVEELKKRYLFSVRKRKIPAIISILNDKDVTSIVKILREVLEPIFFFQIDDSRTLKYSQIPKDKDQLDLFFPTLIKHYIMPIITQLLIKTYG